MDEVRRPRLPYEVFLYIIAVINNSRIPFEHSAYFQPPQDLVDTLKTLSLTHRFLTGPAQRALGSRLSVASLDQTTGLLQSPLLGTCTRELTLILTTTIRTAHENRRGLSAPSGHSSSPKLQDVVTSSLEVMQRASNLCALRVVCPLFSSLEVYTETIRLLAGIGASAKSLRHLCWTGPEYADERDRLNIEEIWHGLRGVRRSLKTLSLRNVELRSSDSEPFNNLDETEEHQDEGAEDHSQLTSLTILKVDSIAFPTPRSVSYLTQLFGRGSLKTLAIDLTSETPSSTYTSDLLRVLGNATGAWSSLEHLRLRIGAGSCRADTDTPALLARFFTACTRLKHFQLWVGRMAPHYHIADDESQDMHSELGKIFLSAVVSTTESFVPVLLSSAGSCGSLESVHLGFFHIAGPLGGHRWRRLDEGVAWGLTKASPLLKLQRLLIDTHEETYEFPHVRQACADVGCTFEKRTVTGSNSDFL